VDVVSVFAVVLWIGRLLGRSVVRGVVGWRFLIVATISLGPAVVEGVAGRFLVVVAVVPLREGAVVE
jgi:hypothetical protein